MPSQNTNTKDALSLIVSQNIITPAEEKFLRERYLSDDERIDQLISRKLISPIQLAKTFSIAYNLPFVRLQGMDIALDVFNAISFELSKKYCLVAYEINDKSLKLAVGKPYLLSANATETLEKLANAKNHKIELVVSSVEDIDWALAQYQRKRGDDSGEVEIEEPLQLSNLPKVDLTGKTIASGILLKFPEEIAKKYRMVVFETPDPSTIKVAIEDPRNEKAKELLNFIEERNDINVELFQTNSASIELAIAQYPKPVSAVPLQPKPAPAPAPAPVAPQPVQPVVNTAGTDIDERNLDIFLGKPIKTVEELTEIIKTGFVPKIVAGLLSFGITSGASDIHLEPSKVDFRLRVRVDGDLKEVIIMPLALHPAVISRIKILSDLKIDEQRIPQDGRYDAMALGHEFDVRVSSLPTVFGEKIVMRLLDKSQGLLTLDKLGFDGQNLQKLTEAITKPWGLVLATGPTGSGKSTTLYAILGKISTPKVNIITLEDPVEYEIKGINQVQVKPKIGFTFAEGLRSVLRQDPNIIMVGEIRDSETASLATHAALTGHLVLSTLHTNDAASTLPRLTNMGVEPFLITSSVNAIIAQRLIRKLCQKCKTAVTLPQQIADEVAKVANQAKLPNSQYYGPKGCPECTTGYKGRIGIYEVLTMSDKVEQAALANESAGKINEIALAEGMISMRADGIIKASKGLTSIDEVFKATSKE